MLHDSTQVCRSLGCGVRSAMVVSTLVNDRASLQDVDECGLLLNDASVNFVNYALSSLSRVSSYERFSGLAAPLFAFPFHDFQYSL